MADVLAERAREGDALIDLARGYVERLAGERNLVEEFRAAHAKGNQLAREAMEIGIRLAGADLLTG
jgi:hypothetical protein